jgi:hypothetical protein
MEWGNGGVQTGEAIVNDNSTILAELRKQTKMLAHIRGHVTVLAWCVAFPFLIATAAAAVYVIGRVAALNL